MVRRPPRSTRTDTLLPYTTLFRSPVRILPVRGIPRGGVPMAVNMPGSTGGVLHVVATPIGNLGDLSPRALDTLRSVAAIRSEEHTSELQSLMRNSYAVFCLKKKQKTKKQ